MNQSLPSLSSSHLLIVAPSNELPGKPKLQDIFEKQARNLPETNKATHQPTSQPERPSLSLSLSLTLFLPPPSLPPTLPPIFLLLAVPQLASKSKSAIHLLEGSWFWWLEVVGWFWANHEGTVSSLPMTPHRFLFGNVLEPRARQAFLCLSHCLLSLSVSITNQPQPPLSSILSPSNSVLCRVGSLQSSSTDLGCKGSEMERMQWIQGKDRTLWSCSS